jgi:ABC-type nitrate/sulfonate/bicarbonate transport system permease component
MDTPLMFAVLVLITVLGLLFYKSAEWLERRLLQPPVDTPKKAKQ